MQSTNRLLTFLKPTCPCRQAKRRHDEIRNIVQRIDEAIDASMMECYFPEPSCFMDPEDDPPNIEFDLFNLRKIEPCSTADDIPGHVAGAFRKLADTFAAAADRIDAEFGKAVCS